MMKGLWTAAIVLFSVTACNGTDTVSVAVKSNDNQTIVVPAATEFTITLGTVGGGNYASPPQISTTAVSFLSADFVSPYVPAGPRQLFRFLATGPGKAIIVFQHTGFGRTVEDTVEVH